MNPNYWRDKNVFVTGCTGFLGSYLADGLSSLGANVTGLVRDTVPRSKLFDSANINSINLVPGSLEDMELLERVLGEYEIDTVFHLAAQAIVGVANRNPVSTFRANIMGTWNVLEACRRSPLVKCTVVASSDKAYGEQQELPYVESMPLQGIHPYDASKSCADILAQTYNRTYNTPVCITRCGNLYGGGDLNFNRIIPQTIKAVLEGQSPVIRSDGTFIRDYFYVEDAVDAYITLAEKMAQLDIAGEAFNFSNEVKLTVLELVKMILELMGSSLEPVVLNEGSHEIRNQYLTSEKARKVLGWQPHFTIEDGLLRTIAWYRDFLDVEKKK